MQLLSDFDLGKSVIISSGGALSSFITNSGTISNTNVGINISDSSLTNGLNNSSSIINQAGANIVIGDRMEDVSEQSNAGTL